MSKETDTLRELYLDVAGGEILTEPQEEGPSYDPVGEAETEFERAVSDAIRQDGVTDAIN